MVAGVAPPIAAPGVASHLLLPAAAPGVASQRLAAAVPPGVASQAFGPGVAAPRPAPGVASQAFAAAGVASTASHSDSGLERLLQGKQQWQVTCWCQTRALRQATLLPTQHAGSRLRRCLLLDDLKPNAPNHRSGEVHSAEGSRQASRYRGSWAVEDQNRCILSTGSTYGSSALWSQRFRRFCPIEAAGAAGCTAAAPASCCCFCLSNMFEIVLACSRCSNCSRMTSA